MKRTIWKTLVSFHILFHLWMYNKKYWIKLQWRNKYDSEPCMNAAHFYESNNFEPFIFLCSPFYVENFAIIFNCPISHMNPCRTNSVCLKLLDKRLAFVKSRNLHLSKNSLHIIPKVNQKYFDNVFLYDFNICE